MYPPRDRLYWTLNSYVDKNDLEAAIEAVVDVLNDGETLYAMHKAIEDTLIEFRDSRISVLGPANGFVVKEKDGEPSSIMRLGTRDGLQIAMKVFSEHE